VEYSATISIGAELEQCPQHSVPVNRFSVGPIIGILNPNNAQN
jgi:hypothetical protein